MAGFRQFVKGNSCVFNRLRYKVGLGCGSNWHSNAFFFKLHKYFLMGGIGLSWTHYCTSLKVTNDMYNTCLRPPAGLQQTFVCSGSSAGCLSNYVDLSDNHISISDNDVDSLNIYVNLPYVMSTCQMYLFLPAWNKPGKNTFLRFDLHQMNKWQVNIKILQVNIIITKTIWKIIGHCLFMIKVHV